MKNFWYTQIFFVSLTKFKINNNGKTKIKSFRTKVHSCWFG